MGEGDWNIKKGIGQRTQNEQPMQTDRLDSLLLPPKAGSDWSTHTKKRVYECVSLALLLTSGVTLEHYINMFSFSGIFFVFSE